MESKTFAHRLSYNEMQPVFKEGSDDPEYKFVTVSRDIVFKELDQYDREQHNLHFAIMSHFVGGDSKPKGKKKLIIDPEFAQEMTVTFIEEMSILNDTFRAQDREILLNDSAALIKFSLWLIPNKVLPFFLKLTENMGQ